MTEEAAQASVRALADAANTAGWNVTVVPPHPKDFVEEQLRPVATSSIVVGEEGAAWGSIGTQPGSWLDPYLTDLTLNPNLLPSYPPGVICPNNGMIILMSQDRFGARTRYGNIGNKRVREIPNYLEGA